MSTPRDQAEREAAAEHLPEPARQRAGIALCLSGGGYRAALFHLGVLRRLNELGALSLVDTVSAVSGGSILAGYLAGELGEWRRSGRPLPGFADRVAPGFRDFTRKNIRTLWILQRALPWNWGDSSVAVDRLESRYEKDIVKLRLDELPARPRYIFCATDLTFGTNWVSERARIGSYQPGYVASPKWPVARAVAASSCFPPVFEPMPVGIEASRFAGGLMTDGAKRTKLIGTLRLTDGGVYDNMALEPVWKDHAVLLVSDGGATFDAQGPAPVWRPFKSLGRYLEIQGRQGAAVRRRWLVASLIKRELRGVYLGIGSSVKQFDSSAEGYNETLVDELISEVRTDLDYFSDGEAAVLQNHGYLLADAAMRVYGAEWITPASLAIPYPEWMDQDKAIAALRGSAKRAKLGHWRAVPAAKSKVRDAWSWLKRVGRRG